MLTISFSNIPKEKYTEFEGLIVKNLSATNHSQFLLNISHVFDLRSYFHYVQNSKNHYFFKYLYQNGGADNKGTMIPGRSRISFRRASIAPQNEYLPTPDEIQLARRIRMMSEEEKRVEDMKLDKIRKTKMKEIMQKIKEEEKFMYNISMIQEKIKDKRRELYQGGTFVSFKRLDLCVIFLRMFQSDLQKEILADANDTRYNYLMKIGARIAPFIDDLRWEHIYSARHYYLVEVLFVLFVSSVNMLIERQYNYKNLNEIILNKQSLSNPTWLVPLVLLLLLQVLISVISVVCLEKLISRYNFYKRSRRIEINFIFFNCFMILNNIVVVFYGFLWGAFELSDQLPEDRKYYFNFYINFQWIKNSLIIIFIPLLQRLVGDYIIKWHLIPFLTSRVCNKKKKETEDRESMKNSEKTGTSENKNPSDFDNIKEKDEKLESDPIDQKEELLLEKLEDDAINNPEDYESQEEESEEEQDAPTDSPKKKKPIHDFGLNSSYLIQVAFFTGFYLSFTSPLLLLITFLGVWLNFMFEEKLLQTVYDKTRYVSISNLFVTIRWAFVAFCFGIVISVSNSKLYMFIINRKSSEISQLSKVTGFQNMIGFCNFAIAWIFFMQMNTSRIMYRVLNSIDNLKRKYGGSFFKHEFERVNYRSQNPFYTF